MNIVSKVGQQGDPLPNMPMIRHATDSPPPPIKAPATLIYMELFSLCIAIQVKLNSLEPVIQNAV